jgi:hypothetical protein
MPRRIDLEADALVVRYSGLWAAAVLTERVRVPYAAIRAMRVGLTQLPGPFSFRLGLSTAPLGNTRRGRFREGGRWSFYDVDDPERTLVIDLEGAQYTRVALTVDDPPSLMSRLDKRRSG